MLCTRCKKNAAVVFITKMENGKAVNEGLCIPCARELGIGSAVGKMMSDPETLSSIENQIADIMPQTDEEMGSVMSMINNIFANGGPDSSARRQRPKDDRGSKDKKEKRIIDSFGENLTKKAIEGRLDKVVGREKEIERMVQILNRRTKNNPALLGEPGVGKTAVAEGLAGRIAAIVAGTQYRGQFEARLKSIIEEVKRLGNIILVIDELHNIVGAGDAEGAMSAANILKPALARGEIQVIGATTLTEYRKHIEKDSALERRFQPIILEEPSVEETVEILRGVKGYYEKYHQITIPEETLAAAARLSERYITDRFLHDKAIDLIDEAGSRANLNNRALTTLANLENQLTLIRAEKENAVTEDSIENYRRAADLKTQECSVLQSIDNIKKTMGECVLTPEDIAVVIEMQTHIPVKRITEEETKKLLSLEDSLHRRIIGQNEAVSAVSKTIRRNRAALSKKKRPASFIFVGPTGVGKTETVKALAAELFDSEDALIRVDMTEYMEKHTVSRLIGSPPGYVGYDDAGQLTEKVRRKPYSVILFDEIEKAHPDVLNILLQIMDDGRVTDSHGKVVSFENTVIVMTSNAGSGYSSSALGFSKTMDESGKTRAMDALKKFLRPEFLNRVDEVIYFESLTKENLRDIVALMIQDLAERAAEKGIALAVTDAARDVLIEKGYDRAMGARPLRRVVSRELEDRLAELIIRSAAPSEVTFDAKDGEIVIL